MSLSVTIPRKYSEQNAGNTTHTCADDVLLNISNYINKI